MKKLLIFSLFLIGISITSIGQTTDNLAKTAIDIIDSTQSAVSNTITAIDISSTFKLFYSDVKVGLIGLAAGLKVGVEHVYTILVKQQVVNSIVWSIYLLLIIPVGYLLYKGGLLVYKSCDEDIDHPGIVIYTVFMGVFCLIATGIGISNLDIIVTGFVNPEYGAIKEIVNFVK